MSKLISPDPREQYLFDLFEEARGQDMLGHVSAAARMFLDGRLTPQQYCDCMMWCFVDDHAMDFIDEGTLGIVASKLSKLEKNR